MNKEDLQKNFEKCLENFNFDRIVPVMSILNWRWFPENKVPDIQVMKNSLIDMWDRHIDDFINKGWESVGSGGFNIFVFKEDNGVLINFVVEEQEFPIE